MYWKRKAPPKEINSFSSIPKQKFVEALHEFHGNLYALAHSFAVSLATVKGYIKSHNLQEEFKNAKYHYKVHSSAKHVIF